MNGQPDSGFRSFVETVDASLEEHGQRTFPSKFYVATYLQRFGSSHAFRERASS